MLLVTVLAEFALPGAVLLPTREFSIFSRLFWKRASGDGGRASAKHNVQVALTFGEAGDVVELSS